MRSGVGEGPLVSVVVNNYNYERYLGEAIDSALAQSHPRVEVVVVDDGSTDGSAGVIEGYGSRVVAVRKENGGQASAINAGFGACSGEVVIFLDADDALLPDACRRVAEAFRERPGLAKVQYRLQVMDGDGQRQRVVRPTKMAMPSGDLRDLILSTGSYLTPPTSGNAIARKVLENLLPMPEDEWRISADGYLANLVPFFGEVLSLHENLGLYREHQSNHWAMQKNVDLKKIRRYIAHDIQKQKLLDEFGARLGLDVEEDVVLRVPSHLKCRLVSLLMDPRGHPYPRDTRWGLVRQGIAGCWKSREFALLKKVFYSMWFVLAAALRGPAFAPLITLGLMPGKRPRFMDLLQSSGSRA